MFEVWGFCNDSQGGVGIGLAPCRAKRAVVFPLQSEKVRGGVDCTRGGDLA